MKQDNSTLFVAIGAIALAAAAAYVYSERRAPRELPAPSRTLPAPAPIQPATFAGTPQGGQSDAAAITGAVSGLIGDVLDLVGQYAPAKGARPSETK